MQASVHPLDQMVLGKIVQVRERLFLAARGVGSVPGDGFGTNGDDALRLAFSCSTEMVREGGRLIRDILTAR